MKFIKIDWLKLLIMSCVFFILLNGCIFIPIKKAPMNVSQLEMYILDNNTNEPLKNIKVIYNLEKHRSVGFHNVKCIPIVTKELMSNENGLVIIEGYEIILLTSEILMEEIFINIDVYNEYPEKYSKKYGLGIPLKSDILWSHFVLYDHIEGIYFVNQNYFPASLNIFDHIDVDGYLINQKNDSSDRDQNFISTEIKMKLDNTRDKIIVKLIRRNNFE